MSTVFAKNLKLLRKQRGYTQTELAAMLGVGRTCIANWECGTRIPDVDALSKISMIFGTSAEALLLPKSVSPLSAADAGIDISKLSDYGIQKLTDYYKALLFDDKCVKR